MGIIYDRPKRAGHTKIYKDIDYDSTVLYAASMTGIHYLGYIVYRWDV